MTTDTAGPYTAAVPATTNPAARASLVIGIVIVVVGVVQQVTTHFIPLIMANLHLGSSAISVFFGIFGAIIGVLAAVGLVLGIIGLGNRQASRAAAGAGTAIALSSLVSVLLGFALPFVINVLTVSGVL